MNKLILALLTLSIGFVAYEVKNPTERFEQVAVKTLPATVAISIGCSLEDPFTGEIRKGTISGSGVFVTPDGHILTCAHLFNHQEYKYDKLATVELYSGEIVTAEILAVGKGVDLAILRAPAIKGNKFVQLADPRKLKVGQEIIAIGSPLGLDFTVTHGIISALFRDLGDRYNVTQHDVFMNPGNSGGPVINLKGELVGINSFIITANPFFPIFTGLGFSVQSGQCLEFLVYHGKTISPHRRYQWLKIANRAKRSFSIQK